MDALRDHVSAPLVCRALLVVVCACVLVAGCRSETEEAAEPGEAPRPRLFAEVTESWGLQAIHDPGSLDDYEMPQIMAGGGAVLDFDRDGALDFFLVDSVSPETGEPAQFFRSRHHPDIALEDVTAFTHVERLHGGMGAAVGDADNDGFPDLYLTCYDGDRLYINNGDGTFFDATSAAGIECPAWSGAASFTDYDGDGDLDLFVVHYVQYRMGETCHDARGLRDYCGPSAFPGTIDRLFENTGQTDAGVPRFIEVTGEAGLLSNVGKGLGVACEDFTGDNLIDFYIANDMEANHFWVQQPGGDFQDAALLQGVALNRLGEAEASMGVCTADLTGDGTSDLFLTHLTGQTNTLYARRPDGTWVDQSAESGLGVPSLQSTGFGVCAIDIEHDGDLDLLIANGAVKREDSHSGRTDGDIASAFAQVNQIMTSTAPGAYEEMISTSDDFLSRREISRGLAGGDFDGDGDVDVLLTNCAGPARIFLNEAPKSGHWLQVQLVGRGNSRDGLAAHVTVTLDGTRQTRTLNPYQGYFTSSDFKLHFGLAADHFDQIDITWSDGTTQVIDGGPADRVLAVIEGFPHPVELPHSTP